MVSSFITLYNSKGVRDNILWTSVKCLQWCYLWVKNEYVIIYSIFKPFNFEETNDQSLSKFSVL